MEELSKTYSDIARFVYIYIKEAHPEDEWQTQSNRDQDVIFKQPKTFAERYELAKIFVEKMGVQTPTLVDDITNTANACYAAWPERLYIVDTEGKIVYKGGMGPHYFDPDEVDAFFKENYAPGAKPAKDGPATATGS